MYTKILSLPLDSWKLVELFEKLSWESENVFLIYRKLKFRDVRFQAVSKHFFFLLKGHIAPFKYIMRSFGHHNFSFQYEFEREIYITLLWKVEYF